MILLLFLIAAVALCVLLIVRLWTVLPPRSRPSPQSAPRKTIPHLLIVLGSGGHTTEMLSMLSRAQHDGLDWKRVARRTWVVGTGDGLGAQRARDFEASSAGNDAFDIVIVPRARRIHQSLLTTPWSSSLCLYACVEVLWRGYPDLILTNGPATATVMILASVLLRVLDPRADATMRTVYVESWARVNRLSLSGRLLCWVADRVLVQWEQLDGVHGRGEYRGVLVG